MERRLAIMQPYLFPYLGYFQLMASVDRMLLLDDVAFINRGWINRNRILAHGKDLLFTLPLSGASQNSLICELLRADDQKWRGKFDRTLRQAYGHAPYFDSTHALVQELLHLPTKNLAEFLFAGLEITARHIGLNVSLARTSASYDRPLLSGQERIIDLCVREGATTYINPPGGRELYDAEGFRKQGINLAFLVPNLVPYPQGRMPFLSGLSIIDVLMHNSPQETLKLATSASIELSA